MASNTFAGASVTVSGWGRTSDSEYHVFLQININNNSYRKERYHIIDIIEMGIQLGNRTILF